MAKDIPAAVQIETFADHHVITQPNPLRKVLRRVAGRDLDDPVKRAEKALAGLSGEFKNWMSIEADRLSAAPPQFSGMDFRTSRAKSCFAPPTTSRATPPHSAFPPPAPPPKACAGSSSTRRTSTRCRPT